MHFFKIGHFSKSGSPSLTTMLTTSAAKFCVEPWSPFSNFCHQDRQTSGKPLTIAVWPECRPEFPSDGDGGSGGVQRTLAIRWDPYSIVPRNQIFRSKNPSLRYTGVEATRANVELAQPFSHASNDARLVYSLKMFSAMLGILSCHAVQRGRSLESQYPST